LNLAKKKKAKRVKRGNSVKKGLKKEEVEELSPKGLSFCFLIFPKKGELTEECSTNK